MKNHEDCGSRARGWRRLAAVTLATMLVALQGAVAQGDTPELPPVPSTTASNAAIRINGELGTFGEVYDISGHERRRPSSTGRLFLRSTLTAWGSVSASLNFMLSNEGNSARQDINQLDFNPRWRWGSAHMGDFSEELTPLTLSGVRIRGGALILSPAKWRLSLLSGLTSRAVSTESSNRSYERMISGVSIGYGRSGGSSIDLIVVSARDRLSSLAELPADTVPSDTTLIDTTQADFEQNPLTVTPQENLVISMAAHTALFNRKVKWRNEFGASAITRDRRSAELDNTDVPEFLTNLFTPRKSSGADFALTSDLSFDLQPLTVTTGFHYVGPGYVSLGVASLMSDKQEFTTGLSYRFRRGVVRVDGAMQRDNLIHQKSYTTDRLRINSLVSYRLRPFWNVTAGVVYVGMVNDAPSDTTRLDYGSWIMRTGQQLTFNRQQGLRSVSVDFIYQHASDKNPFRQAAGVDCNSGSVVATYGVSQALEINSSVSLISAHAGLGKRTLTQNYGLSVRHLALRRKLNSSVSITTAVGEYTTTLRPKVRSSYDLGTNFTVAAELEATSVKGGAVSSRFDEVASRLTFSRRF